MWVDASRHVGNERHRGRRDKNLWTVQAYLLKEVYQQFWAYLRLSWEERYLNLWCKVVMRSRLESFKKFLKMMQGYQNLILN